MSCFCRHRESQLEPPSPVPDAPASCAEVGFCTEDFAVLAPFLPCILAFFLSLRAYLLLEISRTLPAAFSPSLRACVPTLSSSYGSTSRCTADRAAWAAYISRFCALLNRLSSSGVSSALPNRRCWAFSAVFSASVFRFFFLGTDCSTLAFFGGERVFLADDSSLRFSFGLLISVRPPRFR